MSAGPNLLTLVGLVVGAAACLLVDLLLTILLTAVSSLSPVSLRRISADDETKLGFLEEMGRPPSLHRTAAMLLRQISLLGSVLLLGWAAATLGWGMPVLVGVAASGLLGVILLEGVVAPSVAAWDPRRAIRLTAFIGRFSFVLLLPLVKPLRLLYERAGSRQSRTDEEREEDQEEEVEALIEVGEREGLLEAKEGEMMRGVVDLDETPVREIMTPRTDIVALPIETMVSEARGIFLSAGHSRLPVYRDSIDHVVGVLHSRDLFRAWEEEKGDGPISRYMRATSFVPESLSALSLLAEMRQKMHLSVVVDEYGGTAGLVTLEDLLEEIVGDIRDEHEDDEQWIVDEGNGCYVLNAANHVKELENLFEVEFEEREFDTVGGLVVYGFGRVPSAGEILEVEGLRVEVLQAERRRVHRVRVSRQELKSAKPEIQASR